MSRVQTTIKDLPMKNECYKSRQDFSPTRDAISYNSRATWPWSKLPKQHGHEIRPCLETMVEIETHTIGGETAVRYDHVKTGQDFSPTRDAISYHSRATWSWSKLPKQHGHETRPCLETMVETENVTGTCDTLVPSTHGRHCQNEHGRGICTQAWEKERSKTRPCDSAVCTHTPKQHKRTISSSRCKKIDVPASKKRKGAASSSGPTMEIRHPFLQIQLADAVRALLTTDLWGLFFDIVEPTYLEFTLELCSTFHLQTVMTNFDDPGTVQFRLGGLARQLSIPKFWIALWLETREHWRCHHPRHLFLIEYGKWARHRPRLLYYLRHSPPDGAAQKRGHLCRALCDSIGSALRAPQHSSPIILPHSYRPDVPTGHLEHAKYEDDREMTWYIPSSVPPRPIHQGGGPR
ncbi:hypothetical protein GOBAR_AA34912 [Gossypium barbadense]|uniref:Uncharacterized protein n=1 Tax=Gossypium barbadense TaxID=3634 RepID=A0A2P5W3T6_GOSBA|nr:hypothetical protein GOBAR_AA34912 [Gossypium barbadense]